MSKEMLEEKFITTAIAYTNGPPHIGHLYESIIADFIVRYLKLKGHKVTFLTGSDEHGLKIFKKAKTIGIEPIELCNENVKLFKELYKLFNVNYDWFVRTTFPEHTQTAQKVFLKLQEKDLIYKGDYSGWYDTREETYLTEKDLTKIPTEYLGHTRYIQLNEPCYFFKLSAFQDQIIKFIEKVECFDPSCKNEILARLDSPLKDLSITRTSKSLEWGIPVPNDSEHVLYVWFEALLNYLTGKEHFNLDPKQAMTHVIGKDITWFHQVIWIAMLIALDEPLPESYYIHGFVLDANKVKLSKSLGNSFNPVDLIKVKELNPDVVRAYLLYNLHLGSDFGFNENELRKFNNGILADQVGNLVGRVLALGHSCSKGIIEEFIEPMKDVEFLNSDFKIPKFENYSLEVYLIFRNLNKWLTENEPWKILKQNPEKAKWMILNSINYVYKANHLLYPIMPLKADLITKQFEMGQTTFQTNLKVGTKFEKKLILFQKLNLF